MGCILSSPELCTGWRRTKCIDAEGRLYKITGAVHAFVDSVVNDAPIAVTGEDAFDSLAAACAADTSAERSEMVRPETLD